MSRAKGPTYTPDGVTAADATIAASEKSEAAEGLVHGEDVREAAKDALIGMSETDDAHDSGSQLPTDAVEGARGLQRVYRHVRRRLVKREGGDAVDPDGSLAPAPNETDSQSAQRTLPEATQTQSGLARPTAEAWNARGPIQSRKTRGSSIAAKTTHAEGATASGREPRASTTRRKTSTNMTPTRAPVTADGGTTTKMTRAGSVGGRQAGAKHATSRLTRRATTATVGTATTAGAATGAAAGGATATASTTGAATVAAPVAAAVMVIVVLFLLVLTLLAGGAVDEDQRAGAHRLAQTATDEYLEGEARGDYGHKGIKYSTYVRGSHGGKDDWDVCFVTWCMGQAGFVRTGLVARYSDVTSYIAHFRHQPELGEVHEWYGEPYAPVEGDLFIVPYTDGTQHIGIVTSCDGIFFQTVEGDVAGGPNGLYDRDEEDSHGGYVACRTRRTNQYSYTFIHPYYSEEAVINP